MNYKAKSVLYFASLVLAILTYYTMDNTNTIKNTEFAENTITVSTPEALN